MHVQRDIEERPDYESVVLRETLAHHSPKRIVVTGEQHTLAARIRPKRPCHRESGLATASAPSNHHLAVGVESLKGSHLIAADFFKARLREFHPSGGIPLKIGIRAQHLDQRLEASRPNRLITPTVRHQSIDRVLDFLKVAPDNDLGCMCFWRQSTSDLRRVWKRHRIFDRYTCKVRRMIA